MPTVKIPTTRGTDRTEPTVVTIPELTSDDMVLMALASQARQCTYGKSRIGKPKRSKQRAKMVRESRRRNRC